MMWLALAGAFAVAGQLADALSTLAGLRKNPLAGEANPMMRALLNWCGGAGLVVVKVAVAVAATAGGWVILRCGGGPWVAVIPSGIIGVLGWWLAWHNVRLGR